MQYIRSILRSLFGGNSMLKFVIRRVLLGIPVLLAIVFFAFTLMHAIPGGPFDNVGMKSRDPQSLEILKARYGMDKPLLLNLPNDGIAPDIGMQTTTGHELLPDCAKLAQGVSVKDATDPNPNYVEEGWSLLHYVNEYRPRYTEITAADGTKVAQRCFDIVPVLYSDLARSQFLQYLDNALRFDFGPSLGRTTRDVPVRDIIGAHLPISAQLGLLAAFLGFALGIPLGVVAAIYRNTIIDYAATFFSVIGVSMPSYVLGPVLIIVFVTEFKLLPAPNPNVWLQPNYLDWNFVGRLILPLLTLTLGVASGIASLTRASLLQVLQDDYIRTARAKGLRERSVIYMHALKNALIPVATIVGPLLAGILTGTFFIERIFTIPGLGETFLQSISDRDYTLLTGVTILYSTFLILGNILVDVMYVWLDPRIRFD